MAKSQFRYLDADATNVTAAAATNPGIRSRGTLSQGGLTVETIIPLNRFSFFEELSDRLLPPLHLEFEIRVKPEQIGRGDELLLTGTQINKMKKAASERRGADLNISKTQIEKTAQIVYFLCLVWRGLRSSRRLRLWQARGLVSALKKH